MASKLYSGISNQPILTGSTERSVRGKGDVPAAKLVLDGTTLDYVSNSYQDRIFIKYQDALPGGTKPHDVEEYRAVALRQLILWHGAQQSSNKDTSMHSASDRGVLSRIMIRESIEKL
jgi:hypothetical protein